MKALLAMENLQVLNRFRMPDTLMVFDYDGTLAPITNDPVRAFMREETRDLLAAVARRYPTLVLSGRARHDVQRLLAMSSVEVIGNHGSETARGEGAREREDLAHWRTHLQRNLDGLDGIVLEDKGHSLSVHYRLAEDPVAAEGSVRLAASGLRGVRLVGGKCVLNILPKDAPGKGAALAAEMERIGAPRAVFVGDDVTDEDAFALGDQLGWLTIRVGDDAASLAQYHLPEQNDIDALLRLLLE